MNANKEIEYGLGAIKGVASSFIDHVVRKDLVLNLKLMGFFTENRYKTWRKKSLEAYLILEHLIHWRPQEMLQLSVLKIWSRWS